MKKIFAVLLTALVSLSWQVHADYTLQEVHTPLLNYLDIMYDDAITMYEPDVLFLQDLDTDYEYLRSQIDAEISASIASGDTLQDVIPEIAPYIQDLYALLDLVKEGDASMQITDLQKEAVKGAIIRYQKEIVDRVLQFMELPDHDIRESAALRMNFESAYADVTISAPEIISTTLEDLSRVESDMSFDFIVDIKPYFGTGNLKIEGSTSVGLVMDDADVYLHWKHLEVSASGDDSMVAAFEQELEATIIPYYDMLSEKHLYIPSDLDANLNTAFQLQQFLRITDILQSSSLMSPYMMIDSTYYLELNEDTVVSIMDELGIPFTSTDIDYMQSGVRDMGIMYEQGSGSDSMIWFDVDEYSVAGDVALSRTSGVYTYEMALEGREYAQGNIFDLMLSKNEATIYLKEQDTELLMLDWKNNHLDMMISDGWMFTFGLTGHLEPKNVDLTATYNDQYVGDITFSQDVSSAQFAMTIDLSEVMDDGFVIEFNGENTWQEGRYQIDIPSDFWMMDDIYTIEMQKMSEFDDLPIYDEWSCDEYISYYSCMSYTSDDTKYSDIYWELTDTLYSLDEEIAGEVCDNALAIMYEDRESVEKEGCYLWY